MRRIATLVLTAVALSSATAHAEHTVSGEAVAIQTITLAEGSPLFLLGLPATDRYSASGSLIALFNDATPVDGEPYVGSGGFFTDDPLPFFFASDFYTGVVSREGKNHVRLDASVPFYISTVLPPGTLPAAALPAGVPADAWLGVEIITIENAEFTSRSHVDAIEAGAFRPGTKFTSDAVIPLGLRVTVLGPEPPASFHPSTWESDFPSATLTTAGWSFDPDPEDIVPVAYSSERIVKVLPAAAVSR